MLSFTDDGWKEYSDWEGEGKPEKLKGEVDKYSRRIDEKNRLVYIATEGNCTITSCRGHYEDD